jgi:hypothetical protein
MGTRLNTTPAMSGSYQLQPYFIVCMLKVTTLNIVVIIENVNSTSISSRIAEGTTVREKACFEGTVKERLQKNKKDNDFTC